MRRRGQLEQGIALKAAKRDIADRIRCVCQGFSDAEFAALVDRMATIDVKYRLREDWTLVDSFEQSAIFR